MGALAILFILLTLLFILGMILTKTTLKFTRLYEYQVSHGEAVNIKKKKPFYIGNVKAIN